MKGGEELDELDRLIAAALKPPSSRDWHRASMRTLPRRTRLRLWCTGRRDAVAIWLAYHGRLSAAEAIWRLTGAWRKR